jgi:hypothetical protein
MSPTKLIRLLTGCLLTGVATDGASADLPLPPNYRVEETVVSYRGTADQDYLAFPNIIPIGNDQFLISYKRGKSHARDLGATLEIIRFDLAKGKIVQDPIRLGIPEKIMQMGEWIRFSDGKLATFIDAQEVDKQDKHARIGLQQAVSNDTGKTFNSLRRVGLIDGVEYGYLFDSVTMDERVYALVMTFEYLDGGRRSVDVVFTDDNGASWHFA